MGSILELETQGFREEERWPPSEVRELEALEPVELEVLPAVPELEVLAVALQLVEPEQEYPQPRVEALR